MELEKEKQEIITTSIIEDNGYDAVMDLIEKLGKFGFHGVQWFQHEDDSYYGVGLEPFEGEVLSEWARKVEKEVNDGKFTAELIASEAKKIPCPPDAIDPHDAMIKRLGL
jgi:hypothetical protein